MHSTYMPGNNYWPGPYDSLPNCLLDLVAYSISKLINEDK